MTELAAPAERAASTETAKGASIVKRVWDRLGVVFYNFFITYMPGHWLRLGVLRLWGAKIGKDTSVFRGTTVLGIDKLRIGEATVISFRCLLDARGGLTIGNSVVIASDVHFITGTHFPDSDTFEYTLLPIAIGDHAWIASRATVLPDVTIGRGAVVGATSLVRDDVADMEIVAGVPAKVRGQRESALAYRPTYKPPFF
ncbi:acyltransferase [Agromyces albus]|uniref:Acyltransferase n=1 Tax=Agromyces albus TaxID=205332 RepID=A0A4V1QY78_9MICO|nr:acyltransferase [Agromyces albus]RXZ72206.1 acyltransferase [Agromyces albus]